LPDLQWSAIGGLMRDSVLQAQRAVFGVNPVSVPVEEAHDLVDTAFEPVLPGGAAWDADPWETRLLAVLLACGLTQVPGRVRRGDRQELRPVLFQHY
jgi:hypothetical protein